jgi:peptidoglycan/xylan/chitin deacetylase (PgdA/CDA1 family)
MLRQFFSWASPTGRKARLSVLIFHRVLPQPDPLCPNEMHAHRFDELCAWLSAWFNVLPLDQASACMQAGTLPDRAACITFDDGYADNFHVAMPILRRHGLTATFFIATGFLDGGRMWNDTIVETVRLCRDSALDLSELGLGHLALSSMIERRAAIKSLIGQIKYRPVAERISVTERLTDVARARLPIDLMLTSEEVKLMRVAGMQIGAHTVSHPILSRLTIDQARQEIGDSKRFLEQLLGERISMFAYPNGKPGEDYTPQSVDVVRSLGFDAAVSTQWGASRTGDDPLQIKRFTPWDKNRLRFAVRLLRNL